jgi:predicted 3-demethylubiquinone-9 3-methyltransferase (glyoxalase superfamily)
MDDIIDQWANSGAAVGRARSTTTEPGSARATRKVHGWLKDRYGLSWQVIPAALGEPDPGHASRAMQAMLGMHNIDVAGLRAAADAA